MALPLRFYSFTDGGFLNEAHGWLGPVQKELCDIDFDTEIDGIDLWCTWRTNNCYNIFYKRDLFERELVWFNRDAGKSAGADGVDILNKM